MCERPSRGLVGNCVLGVSRDKHLVKVLYSHWDFNSRTLRSPNCIQSLVVILINLFFVVALLELVISTLAFERPLLLLVELLNVSFA
jgi:hypothetical protein